MPVRMQLSKETAGGEQLMIHVEQCNPITGEIAHATIDDMAELMDHALLFADARMYEMNMRHLETYHFEQYFTEGEWLKVTSLFDVLAGRMDPRTLKARWDSIREENAALEKGRAEAEAERAYHHRLGHERTPLCDTLGCGELKLDLDDDVLSDGKVHLNHE